MDSYSLFELNEYVKRVLGLNFPDPIWVRAEISQARDSKGHLYLSLLEKSEQDDAVIAQADAVVWASTLRKLIRLYGKNVHAILQDGMEVQLEVSLQFHERYGFKLIVEDVDTAYAVGKLEQQKQQTLEALAQQKLLDKNGQLPLPPVLQRIAVLSSPQAAGWHDFRQQLLDNPYGFDFFLKLFPISVQGLQAEKEALAQLMRLNARNEKYDCAVIIRGGGARLDLIAFDRLSVCEAIANCTLPIITGIGHEVDETVADRVAHTSVKTPTAAAERILTHNLHFESQLIQWGQQVQHIARQQLEDQRFFLERSRESIRLQSKQLLRNDQAKLEKFSDLLPLYTRGQLQKAQNQLQGIQQQIELLDPQKVLARGYTLTSQDGKIVRSVQDLKEGASIKTIFQDGSVESTVDKKETDE